MRFDKNNKIITLDSDIQEIFKKHGWEVIDERVPKSKDNTHTWIIRAKVTKVTKGKSK